MKYLKFMPYVTVKNASRNRREMCAAADYGFEVYCYSSDRTPPENTIGEPFHMVCDETPVVSYTIAKPRRLVRILRNMFCHMQRLRHMQMDVVSCHNIDSLGLAYLAYVFVPQNKRPQLIYDSHEFELLKKRRRDFNYTVCKWWEGFLMHRCAFSIMVNEGIANEVQSLHHLKERPVVVRSTPSYWVIDSKISQSKRSEFCNMLHAPADAFIIVYTGYLAQNRGLEEILNALVFDKNLYAVWIGDADPITYGKQLLEQAEALAVRSRLLIYSLQPHNELWKFISAASAAVVVMNDDNNMNYHYALPNKFFESIQSQTPIICSDTPEMARLIRQYSIGLLVPPGDPVSLAKAVGKLRADAALYEHIKNNLIRAKEDLCWENERMHLIDAYKTHLKGYSFK